MNSLQGLSSLGRFLLLGLCLPLAACRSAYVDANVRNQTPAALHLVEVDYPSASFGTSTLAAGAEYRYRFQVQGSGKVKLTYLDAQGKAHQTNGPEVTEGQGGTLTITVKPDGSVQWLPVLSSSK